VADIETAAHPSAGSEASPAEETPAPVTEQPPVSTTADESETSEPATAVPDTSSSDQRGETPGADRSAGSDTNAAGGAAIAQDTSAGPFVALLIALLAIGFFVLRALK
jgi:hypothetical protein